MEVRNSSLKEKEISKELFREETLDKKETPLIYIYPEVHEFQIIPSLLLHASPQEVLVSAIKFIDEKYRLIKYYVKTRDIGIIYTEYPPESKMEVFLKRQLEGLSSYNSNLILSVLFGGILEFIVGLYNIFYRMSYEKLKEIAKTYKAELKYLDNDDELEKMNRIASRYNSDILSILSKGMDLEQLKKKNEELLKSILYHSLSDEREEVWIKKLLKESKNILVICGAFHASSLAKKLEKYGRKVVILEPTEDEKELIKMMEKEYKAFISNLGRELYE